MELVFCFYMGKKRNAQDTHPMSMQRGGRVGVVRESPPFDHTIHRKDEEKVDKRWDKPCSSHPYLMQGIGSMG